MATELDAFLATDDEAFERLVQNSVDQYYSDSTYDDMVADYDRKPDFYFTDEQREIAIGRMIETITDAFRPDWYTDHYDVDDRKEEEP